MEKKINEELYKLSKKAFSKKEVPVAAILVCNNKIIAKATNARNKSNLTTDHAEIKVIRKGNKKLKSWRLNECILYVTLEPCEMCLSVIKEARIKTVYYWVKRLEGKKQYNKTNFILMNSPYTKSIKKKYQKKLSFFWKNKRKK